MNTKSVLKHASTREGPARATHLLVKHSRIAHWVRLFIEVVFGKSGVTCYLLLLWSHCLDKSLSISSCIVDAVEFERKVIIILLFQSRLQCLSDTRQSLLIHLLQTSKNALILGHLIFESEYVENIRIRRTHLRHTLIQISNGSISDFFRGFTSKMVVFNFSRLPRFGLGLDLINQFLPNWMQVIFALWKLLRCDHICSI